MTLKEYRTETAKPRSRAELLNRATTYEVVADLPNGETLRLGFTSRPSRRRFIEMVQRHRDAILPHISDDDRVRYTVLLGLQIGPVRIHLTGSTERDCASEESAAAADLTTYPPMPYSPLCNFCWLGHPHSSQAHFDSMKESQTPGTELHRLAVNRGYITTT